MVSFVCEMRSTQYNKIKTSKMIYILFLFFLQVCSLRDINPIPIDHNGFHLCGDFLLLFHWVCHFLKFFFSSQDQHPVWDGRDVVSYHLKADQLDYKNKQFHDNSSGIQGFNKYYSGLSKFAFDFNGYQFWFVNMNNLSKFDFFDNWLTKRNENNLIVCFVKSEIPKRSVEICATFRWILHVWCCVWIRPCWWRRVCRWTVAVEQRFSWAAVRCRRRLVCDQWQIVLQHLGLVSFGFWKWFRQLHCGGERTLDQVVRVVARRAIQHAMLWCWRVEELVHWWATV